MRTYPSGDGAVLIKQLPKVRFLPFAFNKNKIKERKKENSYVKKYNRKLHKRRITKFIRHVKFIQKISDEEQNSL